MKVRDVMAAPVTVVAPDTPFPSVVEVLLTGGVSGVPVVDDDGTLLGVVTEADLVSKEAYGHRRRRALGLLADYFRGRDPQWVRKAEDRTARELMTAAPVTATPDEELAVAARRMLEGHHKRLPVVEGGRLVGIVTRHDLLKPFNRPDPDIQADVDELLFDPLRAPEHHDVAATVRDGVVSLHGTVRWPSDAVVIDALAGRIAGVVAVDSDLRARERPPTPVVPQGFV